MNFEKLNYHLKRIEEFEAQILFLEKEIKKTKDKKEKAKLKSKIKYNQSMINHSNSMIEIYKKSAFEIGFNHNYE